MGCRLDPIAERARLAVGIVEGHRHAIRLAAVQVDQALVAATRRGHRHGHALQQVDARAAGHAAVGDAEGMRPTEPRLVGLAWRDEFEPALEVLVLLFGTQLGNAEVLQAGQDLGLGEEARRGWVGPGEQLAARHPFGLTGHAEGQAVLGDRYLAALDRLGFDGAGGNDH